VRAQGTAQLFFQAFDVLPRLCGLSGCLLPSLPGTAQQGGRPAQTPECAPPWSRQGPGLVVGVEAELLLSAAQFRFQAFHLRAQTIELLSKGRQAGLLVGQGLDGISLAPHCLVYVQRAELLAQLPTLRVQGGQLLLLLAQARADSVQPLGHSLGHLAHRAQVRELFVDGPALGPALAQPHSQLQQPHLEPALGLLPVEPGKLFVDAPRLLGEALIAARGSAEPINLTAKPVALGIQMDELARAAAGVEYLIARVVQLAHHLGQAYPIQPDAQVVEQRSRARLVQRAQILQFAQAYREHVFEGLFVHVEEQFVECACFSGFAVRTEHAQAFLWPGGAVFHVSAHAKRAVGGVKCEPAAPRPATERRQVSPARGGKTVEHRPD